LIGKTILHYKIIEKLGEGGMGVAYKAEDTKLKREVAIKFLPRQIAASDEERARFKIEAQAAAALNHPNIATIHAIEEQDNELFIVMEYIDGRELREIIHTPLSPSSRGELKGGVLSINEIINYAIQIAAGLQAAHEKGVVHRDIKSANIMITDKGQVKIMDFGLAKVSGGAQFTKVGTTLGTAAYMSPEQARGEEVDQPADIWSFGVVLYEMLTGKLPFKGDYEQAVIYAILHEEPQPVADLRGNVSSELAQIITRTLEKEADTRYQKMADLIVDFKNCKEPTSSREAAAEERTIPSIVVLPFANQSPDADNEYFSDGLTEEIIADLAKVRALSVISRTSAMQLKGTDKDVRTIGRELGIRYVLEGSVRKAGNRLRITAQLIDALTDAHVWVEKYNGTVEDVFDLQERVSREIVSALDVTLTSDEDKRLAHHPIADVRAFELYLQARQELRRYATERASKLLAQAVEIEGETPPLRALMAWEKVSQVRAGINRDMRPLAEAEAEAKALLELAPDAPYGHALLGYIEYERGHLPQAVQHLRSALDREPNEADTLFYLGVVYMAAGHNGAAVETSNRFLASDPLAPFALTLSAVTHWFVGRPEEATKNLQRALAIDPQNFILRWTIGYTYVSLGQLSQAAKHVTWLRETGPDVPYTRQLQALVDALKGKKERALACLASVEVAPLDAHNKFHLAESYAMADAIDSALDLLERAVDEGFYPVPFIAEHCPFLEPLRDTSRFAAILAKAQHQADSFERKIGQGGKNG